MRLALLLPALLLLGCSREPPGPALPASAAVTAAATASAPPAPDGGAPTPWYGEPLPTREIPPSPTKFVLGDDVDAARLTPLGWLGLRRAAAPPRAGALIGEAKAGAGGPRVFLSDSEGTPRIVTSPSRVFVRYERGAVIPPGLAAMNALEGGRVAALGGVPSFEWAFDDGPRTVGVGNDDERIMAAARWHVVSLDHDRAQIVAAAEQPETAMGAARWGDAIVVAVRAAEPPGATVSEKVRAVQAAMQGDTADFARLAGPPRGALLYLSDDGHVARREPFVGQRPMELAATDDGWLVVAGEGTAGRMFHDAVVLGRRRGETAFRVLARDLDMPGRFVQRGTWVCFVVPKGDTPVVHCLDPGRGLHVTATVETWIASMFDIEVGPTSRAIFRETKLEGLRSKTLAISLP